jgi:hypothetical protein
MMRTSFAKLCFILAFSVCTFDSIYAQGIVYCVYPGRVAASRVQGQVCDPFGVAVPGVAIALVDERGSALRADTDSQGRFRLAVSPGKYSFKAVLPMFQSSQTELNVAKDLTGIVRPSELHVILGLNGSYCAWVTTSQKGFQQIISGNKKRFEEIAQ